VTVAEAVPELQRPDEITSSNAARSFAVETPTTPIEVATLSIGPSSIEPQLRVDESLIDLPLVIDDTDETESTAAGGEEWHVGRQFGIAAAALIACGALGWFVGPKMTTLVETAQNVVAEWPSAATRAPEADAAPTSGEPAPREPLPPVHVAVDEVAAATTIDTPPSAPEPRQPETTEPAAIAEPAPVPPPPVEPARAESRSDSAVLAAARPEPAPPTAPPAPAPVSTLPHTPTVEKSATLPPLAENNRPTIPTRTRYGSGRAGRAGDPVGTRSICGRVLAARCVSRECDLSRRGSPRAGARVRRARGTIGPPWRVRRSDRDRVGHRRLHGISDVDAEDWRRLAHGTAAVAVPPAHHVRRLADGGG
jgi:hypothetical protein